MSQESQVFSSIHLSSILHPLSFNTLEIQQLAEVEDKRKGVGLCHLLILGKLVMQDLDSLWLKTGSFK